MALAAARRVAATLGFARIDSRDTSEDQIVLAGAALLLLVVAAGSTLRLSARIPDDLLGGRSG